MKAFLSLFFAAAILATITVTTPFSGGVITVDPAITYQTMTGWEATAKTWEDDKANDRFDPTAYQYMGLILDTIVNQLGVNRLRLEIKSGAENPVDYWIPYVNGTIGYLERKRHRFEKINDNSDPNVADPDGFQWEELDWKIEKIVLPMRDLLAAKGENLYINLCYGDFVTGSAQGSLSHAKNPAEYAEFITETFKHIQAKYGIIPDAFEIILEPDNTVDWRGTQTGQGMVAAVTRLNANGFFPAVIAPSNAALSNAISYFDEMAAAVPESLQKMDVLSYHRYGGVSTANLQAIKNRADSSGLQTAMSEWLNGDIGTLTQDLKLAGVSFWQQWAISTRNADSGKFYLWADLTNPTNPIINLSSRSNLLQQYFKYVRLNAVRVSAASTNTGSYDPVAFRNTDGSHVVVIKNSSAAPFSIQGLPPGTYGITYSSPGQNNIRLPDVTIPAGGTITTHGGPFGAVTVQYQHP